jgi:hypothetical protein
VGNHPVELSLSDKVDHDSAAWLTQAHLKGNKPKEFGRERKSVTEKEIGDFSFVIASAKEST